ncbi:RNA-directed DNA polymerase [Candidatus Saccharibacteria bacterium]|nr:RNA-directed DNA polymerase [Candidatus Saccharibacteria bacterium]
MPVKNETPVKTKKDIRKMMERALKTMSEMGKPAFEALKNDGYQDFFGYLRINSDEEASEWLRKDGRNLLLAELYIAERLARKGGKRKTMDTHGFEMNLFENLMRLRDALWDAEYYPSRGTVHVIFDPVQREIFAAPYVDRILHHWVVGTIMKWQDSRLIFDSYSCRKNKGTLFGIKRLRHHILSVSDNMRKRAYVVQLDISGYFMHIQRDVLYRRVLEGINKQFPPKKRDKRYFILRWAVRRVVFDDPTEGVRLQGTYADWRGLPDDKSLMMQPPGQGMVIGNYTSQTFSNIYLDPLDRFITMTLGWKHYGRYVDDFFIVVTEEELPSVRRDIQAIQDFLAGYGLSLNKKKTKVTEAHKGVKFLGAVVRGFYIYPGKRIVQNFHEAVYKVAVGEEDPDVIVSYLGMFSHYDAGKIIRRAFAKVGWDYVYDKKHKI